MPRLTPVRALQSALVALFGAAIFLVTPACAPECVDKFDCASKAKPDEVLTCDNGQCVPASATGGGTGGGAMGGGTGGGGGGGDMDAGTGGGGGDMDAGTGGGGGDMDAGTGGGGGDMDAGTGGGGGDMDAGMTLAGTYVAKLTNSQEVPPNTQGTSGSGTFTLTELADGGYNVAWNVTHDIPSGQPTAAHIHTGIGATNGGVFVNLGTSLASPIMGNADVTPAEAVNVAEGRTYVNIHTTRNPGGEIRGQLIKPGQMLTTALLAPVTRPDGGMLGGANGGAQFVVTNPDGGTVFVPGESITDYEGSWSIAATKATLRLDLTDGGTEDVAVLNLTDGGMGARGSALFMPSSITIQPYLLVEDADGPALRGPVNAH